ncbi:MAG: helix-hairpin-helix domain-containing protein [Chloroflexi bacterium]|nr:helix-hairpin-helix domain-containing protein [Chloroflexota bacterium]
MPARIAVYVSGAVQTPGVYELPDGARVDEAIEAAGGPTAEADLARVNLAHRLRDEEQVYVPRIGEEASPPVTPAGTTGSGAGGKININTTTTAEFETLPGIGPALAQRIVEYREKNGPFASIDGIKQVGGIGDKVSNMV